MYAKERRLVEIVKAELQMGRRCCHVYAVYTRKRDVTRRLESILAREGIRVAVLTSDVPPEKREGWFAQRVREGVQVTISHPKIIETGIDLLSHSSLIFFESGYSLHTLRQASRRSWRIGQRQPVRVFYLHYEETMQSSCLRLMGRKLLVSLAMEGKFSRDGLQSLDEDDDMLTAMARELVTENGVGESAAAVWRQIQAENSNVLNSTIIAARACAGCPGCGAHNGARHGGLDHRGGRSSEIRDTPAGGASGHAAQRGCHRRICNSHCSEASEKPNVRGEGRSLDFAGGPLGVPVFIRRRSQVRVLSRPPLKLF